MTTVIRLSIRDGSNRNRYRQQKDQTEWYYFAHLRPWAFLYNLRRRPGFVRHVAANLEGRGLAQIRRLADGEQVRLTPQGKRLATNRRRALTRALKRLGIPREVDLPDE